MSILCLNLNDKKQQLKVSARLLRVVKVVLALTVLTSQTGYALDYEPSELRDMIARADYVILGRVEHINNISIKVTIIQEIIGNLSKPQSINIQRYRIWYTPQLVFSEYKLGQEYIWFLNKRTRTDVMGAPLLWYVFGQEGEGELPLVNGQAFIRSSLTDLPKTHTFDLYGKKQPGQYFKINTFISAISNYRQCVQSSDDARCSEVILNPNMQNSVLHEYLFEKIAK